MGADQRQQIAGNVLRERNRQRLSSCCSIRKWPPEHHRRWNRGEKSSQAGKDHASREEEIPSRGVANVVEVNAKLNTMRTAAPTHCVVRLQTTLAIVVDV